MSPEQMDPEDLKNLNVNRLKRAELIAGFGNWKFDLNTHKVDASDGARRIYGLGEVDWTIENVQKIPLPAYRPVLDQALNDLIQNKSPYDVQFTIKRLSDGEIREIHSIAEFDREQNAVFGVIHDITERTHAENALRDSEERWKVLVQNAPDVIILTDNLDRIVYINRNELSAAAENVIGTSIYDWLADEHLQLTRQAIEHAWSDGEPQYYECLLKKDYPDLWYANRVMAIKDGGRGDYLMWVSTNITENKRTVQALQVSLEKYRTLFEAFPLGITIADDKGNIIEVNKESEDLLGTSPDEQLQRSLGSLDWQPIHSDGSPMLPEEFPSVIASKEKRVVKNVVIGVPKPSGDVSWLNVSAAPIPLPGYGAAITYGDMTEQKKVEQALRESEEKYRQLIENASEAIYVVQKGRFVFANPKCEIISGLPVDQLIGKPVTGLLVETEKDKFYEHHQKIISGAISHDTNIFHLQLGDGRKSWLEVNAVRIMWGNAPASLNFAVDITERIHAEEEIKRLNGDLERRVHQRTFELEAAYQELESFAYSVSHDLRSPLRAVDGYSKLLLDEYNSALDENAQDYIRHIRMGVQRMGRLIEDLLRLSRVTRAEMNFKKIDLSSLADEIMAELKKADPERKVEFRNTSQAYVTADLRLMRVLMENLLGNAWKFTSQHASAAIEFGQKMEGDKTIFFVRDDGAGFDMQYVHKLFGVFQRLHLPNQFSGNGIGLATAQRILMRHGGHIWAEGTVERGAAFYFTME